MGFRRAMLKAAKKAVKNGELSKRDQQIIRWGTLWPRLCRDIHDEIVLLGVTRGVIPPQDASNPAEIDWDNFLGFLQELLPLILEWIQMFMVIFA